MKIIGRVICLWDNGFDIKIIRKLLWFFLILFCYSCAEVPEITDQAFLKLYGFEGLDVAGAVEQTSDGGYVLIGTTDSHDTVQTIDRQMYAMKIDGLGMITTENVFGDTANSEGRALKLTSDGGYLFFGDILDKSLVSDMYLVKTDAALNKLWDLRISVSNKNEHGYAITILPSGNYFLLGTSTALDGTSEMLTAVVTPDGKLAKAPSKPGLQFRNDNVGKSVVVRADGRLAWCGTQFRDHVENDPGTSNIRLILATEDGISDGGDFDYGRGKNDVAVDIQKIHGGFILVGTSENITGEGSKIYLINTDESGKVQWERPIINAQNNSLSKDGNQAASSVCPTKDGGYIIAGITDLKLYDNQEGQNIFLVKTNGIGEVEWEEIYGGKGKDDAAVVRQTSDGGYVIACTLEFNGDPSICLIKTNSRGKIIN